MRLTLCLLLALVSSFTAVCQSAAPVANAPLPPLPKEPAAIFAAAAPLYDFSSPALKPFHLKASYQLFDEKGQPTAQGTYDYWWASPTVYRSTWSRPGMEHTDWHVDGKHSSSATGPYLEFFERKLQSDLLDPLPKPEDLDPAKVRLTHEEQSFGSVKLPCVMVIRKLPQDPGRPPVIPLGLFPTFCFDPGSPTLRAYYAFGATSVVYNKIARLQGRMLPMEIAVVDRGKKVLTAKVESVTGILPTAPELTPVAGAVQHLSGPAKPIVVSPGLAQGLLLKRAQPAYPEEARKAHLQGTVVLEALIGTDGRIHDLTVVDGPAPSLIAAALQAVLQWEYKPYALNGAPVAVNTTINVVFQLGGV